MPLPPASSKPRPSTRTWPSVLTSALSREITQGKPPGLTPSTVFGVTVATAGAQRLDADAVFETNQRIRRMGGQWRQRGERQQAG